jgi:hypothetical protein
VTVPTINISVSDVKILCMRAGCVILSLYNRGKEVII